MNISRSIDIEDAVREELSEYMAVYCRPLPKEYTLPNILISATGGSTESTTSGKGKVDSFTVVLDSRAEHEAEALECLRTAVAILEANMNAMLNSLYSWGSDPTRPDLAMCSATLIITKHRETLEV